MPGWGAGTKSAAAYRSRRFSVPARRLAALPAALGGMLAVILGLGVPAAAGAAPGWAGAGIVRAPGGLYLTDARGRRLELHGANLVAKCGGGAVDLSAAGTPCVGPSERPRLAYVLSPRAADPGRRFTAADARTLARLGFNVIRLGFIWEGLEPGPRASRPNSPRYCAPHRAGTPYPSLGRADPYNPTVVRVYLGRTETIVRLLARAGLRVIIDMHSDLWGSAFSNSKGATPWNGEGLTQTFRYRYAVDRSIRAPTDIEVPPYTYPFGYTVAVTGARVVSAPDAQLLELRAKPHASQVALTPRSLTDFPFPRY